MQIVSKQWHDGLRTPQPCSPTPSLLMFKHIPMSFACIDHFAEDLQNSQPHFCRFRISDALTEFPGSSLGTLVAQWRLIPPPSCSSPLLMPLSYLRLSFTCMERQLLPQCGPEKCCKDPGAKLLPYHQKGIQEGFPKEVGLLWVVKK